MAHNLGRLPEAQVGSIATIVDGANCTGLLDTYTDDLFSVGAGPFIKSVKEFRLNERGGRRHRDLPDNLARG